MELTVEEWSVLISGALIGAFAIFKLVARFTKTKRDDEIVEDLSPFVDRLKKGGDK